MRELWEDFVYRGHLNESVKQEIQEAWLRSKQYGVNPHVQSGTKMLLPAELEDLRKKKKELLHISLPLMENLYFFVKGSGFLVILCDEKGFLMEAMGDEETLEQAKNISFVEGALWSEEAMGANAIGTCIALDKPIQVWASEHYTEACHPWTCSAAPIHDSAGEIIGILNMSGPGEKVHPHTLGMVVSTAAAIEKQLQIIEKTRGNAVMKSLLEATTDTLSEGMIIVDTAGEILKTNEILHRIIGKKEHELVGKNIREIFDNELFQEISSSRVNILDRETKLKVTGSQRQVQVLITSKGIFQNKKKIGKLLTIKEIHKVRQMINKFSGNQAKVTFRDIVGESEKVRKVKLEAIAAASSDSNVLLTGESGTGKDIFAQAIHNESDRRYKPFIAINCGGVPRDLLGSELFGYEDGAFTGARRGGTPGKFELAEGGTIFLDEIGEMSLEMQVLLLRVLQDKEVVRIGGHKIVPVNVRIIAATNKNLREEVKKGSFREDLFFRLNVIPVTLPPLRERPDDIPRLAKYFIEKLAMRFGKAPLEVKPDFYESLQRYEWPGNVRELQNILERAIVKGTGNKLCPKDLPEDLFGGFFTAAEKGLPVKDEIKKQALVQSIEMFKGNYSRAARHLGISRSTLYRQMERYGVR
ncbi:sigma-54-dependent Fis family transcriptional regulator [Siminovitchia acidinfaciens]|uniref:Sigma-54-dependent Fis family transcriptional regulator n=1 Tax=Siminovitchia acidinfaciens TaxID=2321395 RepID=A0A429Y030_9BACI|nr:sigma-54-dependent Fis family transcriptional regulator [Siminovitchia acidinfaciens]RST74398.1 sigma-54-dependent Fis family transcriptional regulator [Siminovitchia acidinfaciens]